MLGHKITSGLRRFLIVQLTLWINNLNLGRSLHALSCPDVMEDPGLEDGCNVDMGELRDPGSGQAVGRELNQFCWRTYMGIA